MRHTAAVIFPMLLMSSCVSLSRHKREVEQARSRGREEASMDCVMNSKEDELLKALSKCQTEKLKEKDTRLRAAIAANDCLMILENQK